MSLLELCIQPQLRQERVKERERGEVKREVEKEEGGETDGRGQDVRGGRGMQKETGKREYRVKRWKENLDDRKNKKYKVRGKPEDDMEYIRDNICNRLCVYVYTRAYIYIMVFMAQNTYAYDREL